MSSTATYRTDGLAQREQGIVPGQTDHLVALTGLRGLAAWWVVLFHFRAYLPEGTPSWISSACSRGYLAVDLFFILSGFIIGYNYLPGFRHLRLRRYVRFLGLRLARVYPLHIVMLVVFLVNPLALLLGSSHGIDGARYDPLYFVMSLFLVQNWGFTDDLGWNVPAWSISTEWFAYICFPLIAWVVNRIPRRGDLLILGIATLLSALALKISITSGSLGGDIPHDGLFRCFIEFSTGALLYQLWRQFGSSTGVRGGVVVLAGGCVVLCGMFGVADFWLMPLAFAAVIFSLAAGLGPFSALLSHPVLQVIGACSYSTYLVHYFIRDWVKFLLVHDGAATVFPAFCYVAATAVFSLLLYRLVEVPGRRVLRERIDRFIPGSAEPVQATRRM